MISASRGRSLRDASKEKEMAYSPLSKLGFPFAAALIFVTTSARAAITPIPVAGFNQDIVVEATAINDAVTHYSSNITASMDNGVTKTGDTWYERGLNTAFPTTGLPMNLLQTAQDDPTSNFKLGAAQGNNALLVDAIRAAGSLEIVTPVKLSKLVIIASSGNGSMTGASLGLQFTDLGPAIQTTYDAGDWFNLMPRAITANGRVNALTGSLDDVNSGNPRLYYQVIDMAALGAADRELRAINFGVSGGPNTHAAIMAISGDVVPEPGALSLLVIAATMLFRRRGIAKRSGVN
jgi:hypothetical protein